MKVFGSIGIIVIIVLGSAVLINPKNRTVAGGFKMYAVSQDDFNNNTLSKDARIIFDERDIKVYNWKEQEIILKSDFLEKIDNQKEKLKQKDSEISGSKVLNTKYTDRFVILLNEEIIFGGAFEQPWYSSYKHVGISVEDIAHGIRIKWNDESKKENVYDKRIYKYLKGKEFFIE